MFSNTSPEQISLSFSKKGADIVELVMDDLGSDLRSEPTSTP